MPAPSQKQRPLGRGTWPCGKSVLGAGWCGRASSDVRPTAARGLTGTNRERPGLREALAACQAGDTLVVTKLDRLARSLPDARAIADEPPPARSA